MNTKPPDIASASIADTSAARRVNPETGIAAAEIDGRRRENGFNEVADIAVHRQRPAVKDS